jgi:2-oxoglutarate/2-oxoacid ferredoxin oxidoreductase subunit alpha
VEDCFYTAIEAVNIARKYNVPVIILSDQSIATRIEAFEEPNLEKCCQDIDPRLFARGRLHALPADGEIQPAPRPARRF